MLITRREEVTTQGFCKIPSSGWGGGERLFEFAWEEEGWRLFEAGRLLTFSAFRMGAYSRWLLIRINTVSDTNFIASRHIKKKKFSLPLNLRPLKTPLLKFPIRRF